MRCGTIAGQKSCQPDKSILAIEESAEQARARANTRDTPAKTENRAANDKAWRDGRKVAWQLVLFNAGGSRLGTLDRELNEVGYKSKCHDHEQRGVEPLRCGEGKKAKRCAD